MTGYFAKVAQSANNMRMMNSIPSAALTIVAVVGSQLESFRGVSLLFLLSIDDAFNPQIIIIFIR